MRRMLFLLCLMLMIAPLSWLNAQDTDEAATAADRVPQYREIARIKRGDILFRGQMTFNPDGTEIAAPAPDTGINIWNVLTGDVRLVLEQPLSMAVSWSPDGTMIAAGSDLQDVQVWDSATGELLFDLPGVGRYTSWSPDSTQLVTSRGLLDIATGEKTDFRFHWWYPDKVYWSPDGTMIAGTSWDEDQYLIISSVDGKLMDTFWAWQSAAWSPDSTRIASSGQIRDIETGLPVVIIPQMTSDIAWHPNEEWIASTGDNGQIFLWDATTGELLTSWQVENCVINDLVWSADGERFAHSCYQYESKRNDLVVWERVR